MSKKILSQIDELLKALNELKDQIREEEAHNLKVVEKRQRIDPFGEMLVVAKRQRDEAVDKEILKSFPPLLDFEAIYKEYPRKMGKSEGIKRCKQQIKSEKDYQDLMRAVQAYRRVILRDQIPPEFIKHFSTFVGAKSTAPWRDWLEIDKQKEILNKPTYYKPPVIADSVPMPEEMKKLMKKAFTPLKD